MRRGRLGDGEGVLVASYSGQAHGSKNAACPFQFEIEQQRGHRPMSCGSLVHITHSPEHACEGVRFTRTEDFMDENDGVEPDKICRLQPAVPLK